MSRRMGCVRKYMIRNTIYKLGLKLANLLLGLLTNLALAGAGSLAKLQPSARLGKTFPVGWWVGDWVGGLEKLRIRLSSAS